MSHSKLTAAIVVLTCLTAQAGAQTESAEIDKLKKEMAELRKELAALRKEVALLRVGRPTVNKAGLAARFEAATQLTRPSEKQEAFTSLAMDAARAGDAKITKQALEKLTSPSNRQETTFKTALLLAYAGQEEEAVALAKSLNSPSKKQTALSKIAKGEVDE